MAYKNKVVWLSGPEYGVRTMQNHQKAEIGTAGGDLQSTPVKCLGSLAESHATRDEVLELSLGPGDRQPLTAQCHDWQ
jgi:hypothetical protein